jgi:hypothetical protein
MAVWLSGWMPFEVVQSVLQRIGQIDISRCSIWRRAQERGALLREYEQAQREQAMMTPVQWEPPSRAEVPDQRMGVAMDGTLINVRKEGWKEVKVACVFDVEVRQGKDRRSEERIELAHAVHNSYVTHLGGPEIFGEKVWAEARRRGWEHAQDTIAIGDGAAWIWNLVATHFDDSCQLVDWYHAKQHLVSAGQLLKKDATPAYQRWINSRETALYQGHADWIADELTAAAQKQPKIAEAATREAHYFRTNQHRMAYLEMREEEWPLGSGMVESAGKQLKTRLCGPGMHWSRTGAENLLSIRTAILSRRFAQVWHQAHDSPLN